MKIYYFDNSATSNPKPQIVYKAVNYALQELNANPGRGGHRLAVQSSMEIYKVREKLAKFFNVDDPLNVAFTNNSTTALNYAIKSILEEGDLVITTNMEHNSVLRPIFGNLDEKKLTIKIIESENAEEELKKIIAESGKNKVKAFIVNHMSNVNGKTLDIEKLGKICSEENIKFIVDVSQSAGIIEIDMKKMHIDILCFTGHKSLYGIQGIGGLCVKKGIYIKPLIAGGTGSHSTTLKQPLEMPDVVEAGTVNTPGIISLGAGLDFINEIGLEKIYSHEFNLKKIFIEKLKKIDKNNKMNLYYTLEKQSGPVVSLNIKGISSATISQILDEEFRIITRSGLHCAPLIHKKYGTEESGAVRFSFGFFNTEEEVEYAVNAINIILNNFEKY